MTTVNKNLAMVLIAVVVVSTGGVFAFTENAQPQQTPSSLKGIPVVLGHLELVAKDSQGNIKAYRQTDNLVMSNGKNATSNLLFGTSLPVTQAATAASFKFIGVGTGSTVLYGDKDVLTPRAAHISGAIANINNGGGSGMGAQIQGTWAANRLQNGSGTVGITEAGLFDSFVNGTVGPPAGTANIYAHQTFTIINVAAADTLQVTWKITFS